MPVLQSLAEVTAVGSIKLSKLALRSQAGHLPGLASFKHLRSARLLHVSAHRDLLVFYFSVGIRL